MPSLIVEVSDNVDTPIPSGGSLSGEYTGSAAIRDQRTTSVINLGDGIDSSTATSVRVTIVRLDHTYTGDLVISLPDNFTQILRNRVGGSADNINDQSFLITNGGLIGGSSEGNWTLLVEAVLLVTKVSSTNGRSKLNRPACRQKRSI